LLLQLLVDLGAAHGSSRCANRATIDGTASSGFGRIATENQGADQASNFA
jgi:hypothetical protein